MSQQKQNGRVRILHAAIDIPAIDVQVDNATVVSNLKFSGVSGYFTVKEGDHSARVFRSGEAQSGKEVLTGELEDVKAGQDFTLAVLGKSPNLHAKVLYDTTSAPVGDRAKVRFLHASPDAPPVDFAVGGVILFNNVPFREPTDFAEVPAGTVDLEVRPAGSTDVVYMLQAYTLAAGNMYTFVAMGVIKGTPALVVAPLVTVSEPLVTV